MRSALVPAYVNVWQGRVAVGERPGGKQCVVASLPRMVRTTNRGRPMLGAVGPGQMIQMDQLQEPPVKTPCRAPAQHTQGRTPAAPRGFATPESLRSPRSKRDSPNSGWVGWPASHLRSVRGRSAWLRAIPCYAEFGRRRMRGDLPARLAATRLAGGSSVLLWSSENRVRGDMPDLVIAPCSSQKLGD